MKRRTTKPSPGTVPTAGGTHATSRRCTWDRLRDHFWGPSGSIAIHVLVLILLFTLALRKPQPADTPYEAQLMTLTPLDLRFRPKPDLSPPDEPDAPALDLPNLPADTAPDEPPSPVTPAPPAIESIPLDARMALSALTLPISTYSSRPRKARESALRGTPYGASIDDALDRALRWLKEHQRPDGAWDGPDDTAMTGLALLTFLAHGEIPGKSKDFSATVDRAIRWLADRFDRRNDGSFCDTSVSAPHGRVYANAIALYGPVYGTTFSALTLSVYFRHMTTAAKLQSAAAPPARRDPEAAVEIL